MVQDDSSETKPYCFASLTPYNVPAIRLASQVYELAHKDANKFSHHLSSLCATGSHVPIRELLEATRSSLSTSSPSVHFGSSSSEATVPDEEIDPMNELVWPTRYHFTLPQNNLSPRLGWIAGYGHQWELPDKHGKVDLLLAIDSTLRNESQIKSTHARFNFFSPSGQFGIVRGREGALIRVNGETIGHRPYLLLRPQEQITFSDLEFRFSYLVKPTDQRNFQDAKNNYLVNTLHVPLPNGLTSVTPSVYDEHIGQWTLMQTAGSGTESVVRAAVSRSGCIGAVVRKEYYRRSDKQRTDQQVENIKRVTSRIQQVVTEGENYVMQFHDSIMTSTGALYVITVPLGLCDFASRLFRENGACHEGLFSQCVLGVGALHKAGFLHGNIKLMNLVVVSFDPPNAAIIDIAGAVDIHSVPHPEGILATPGRGGTVGYLSPEREASGNSRYSFPSDIWSLGTVGMQIFSEDRYAPFLAPLAENPFRDFDLTELRTPLQASSIADTRHLLRNRARLELDKLTSSAQQNPEGVESLLKKMLELDARRRISAQEACHHPFVVKRRRRSPE